MRVTDLIKNLMVNISILGVILNTNVACVSTNDILEISKIKTEQSFVLESGLRDVFGIQTDVSVLMYHHIVSTGDKNDFPYIYTRKLEQFERDMAYLRDYGYNTITIRQLVDFMENGTRLPERPVVITFDDGFESVYKYAYPILRRNSQKAILAIIVSKVGLEGTKEPAYCSWEQLEEMEASGVIEIVSHTHDLHPEPTILKVILHKLGLNVKKLKNESWEEYETRVKNDLLLSKKIIEDKLDKRVNTLAWPWGSHGELDKKVAEEVGYKYFFTTEDGSNRHGSDVTEIRRNYVFGFTPLTEGYRLLIGGKGIDFASQLERSEELKDRPPDLNETDIFSDCLRIFEIEIPF